MGPLPDDYPYDINFKGELLDSARLLEEARLDLALHQDKTIQHLHLLTGAYARGRDYSNFIIAAGYAAFIALWAGTAKDIGVEARLLSGGLLGLSLIVFVAFEIVKMAANMREQQVLSDAVWHAASREDLADRVRNASELISMRDLMIHDIWPLVFFGALIPGLLGAGLLAITLLANFIPG